jgi:hypothetical protein
MDKAEKPSGLILAFGKPKEESEGESGEEMMAAEDAAADAVMSAIQEGDRSALKDALRSFVAACKEY